MVPLDEIFCFIDDFCKSFENVLGGRLLLNPEKKRLRSCRLSLSEMMTILVLFQFSHYRTFKDFYISCLSVYYKQAFPSLLSYNRFIEIIPTTIMPLYILLLQIPGQQTGRYFVDSTKLEVCHNLRINRHKVFEGMASRGKTSTGWFFGFKLHVIMNNKGELMSFKITPGNVHDASVVKKMMSGLQGWLFGDRGYISQKLSKNLAESGVEIITTLKKNMKKIFIEPIKKWWLSKRGLVETMFDQLKAILHVQHTRHRSPLNFLANTLAALLAYNLKPSKPHISFAGLVAKKLALTSSSG